MEETATCCCTRQIVLLEDRWFHVDDHKRRCYPESKHPVDRQLRARPWPQNEEAG